jgi:hypothetical protein
VRLVGIRKADEVVERDQARVVVAGLEAERFGERVEQEDLAGAAAADEQQRVLGDEGREDGAPPCRAWQVGRSTTLLS